MAMYAYFDRPDIALKQAASFFEKAQEEEIGHAKAFIKYQNTRGGKVALQRVEIPMQDFSGDATTLFFILLLVESENYVEGTSARDLRVRSAA